MDEAGGFTLIETIIRDPLWAFVFWEIRNNTRDIYENAVDFDGYCLRVIPLKHSISAPAIDNAASFTVSVGKNDSSRYLGFTPNNQRCYKIELCAVQWENFTVLAESRPFVLPRLIQPKIEAAETASGQDEEIQALYKNPLAQLSGIDNFLIYRSIDRRSRILNPQERL
jgi:hypothetical protein